MTSDCTKPSCALPASISSMFAFEPPDVTVVILVLVLDETCSPITEPKP